MNTSLKVKDNFTCLFITKTMETKTYRMVILSDQTFLYSRGLFVHFQIWNNLDFKKFKILLNQHFVQLERLIFRQFQSSNRVFCCSQPCLKCNSQQFLSQLFENLVILRLLLSYWDYDWICKTNWAEQRISVVRNELHPSSHF